MRRPHISTPLPYTSLFRSQERRTRQGNFLEPSHHFLLFLSSFYAIGNRGRRSPPRMRTKSAARRAPASISDRVETRKDRKSTRLNSSHPSISYGVCCWKKK